MSAPQPTTEVFATRETGAPWFAQLCSALWMFLALAAPWWTKASVLLFRILVGLWLLGIAARCLKPRWSKLFLPVAFFIVWTAISSGLSYDPHASWGRMRGIALALIAVMLPHTVANLRQLRGIAAAVVLSTTAIAIFTLWQYSFGIGVMVTARTPALMTAGLRQNDIIRSIDGKRVNTAEQAMQQVQRATSSQQINFEIWRGAPFVRQTVTVPPARLSVARFGPQMLHGHAHPERAQGFFAQYISFAEFLMLASALTFGLGIAATRQARIILFACFTVIAGALLLTLTRATWLGLLVGCVAAVWVRSSRKVRLGAAIAAAVALVASFVVLQHRRHLGSVENDPGTEYRLMMWRDGVRLAREHPLFGVGMDSVFTHADEWHIEAYKRFPYLKSHFHSSYIQVAAECGVPALAFFVWILWSYGRAALKIMQSGEVRFPRGAALGGFAAVIAFSLSSVVHYTLGDSEVMLLFWLILGMVHSLRFPDFVSSTVA